MKEQIAQKLIILRGLKSREQVAADIGVSCSAIQMYENGQRMPRDDIKVKLAEYYQVSVDDLFFSH